MSVILIPLIQIILVVIKLYIWALVISAVLSWLVAFNIVNTSNRFVYMVGSFLHRITEPALRPLRRFIPVAGGMDLTPLVLILILWFIDGVLNQLLFRLAVGL